MSRFGKQFLEFYHRHEAGILGTIIFHLLAAIIVLSVEIHRMEIHREMEIVLDMPDPEQILQFLEEQNRRLEIINKSSDEAVQEMLRSLAVNKNVRTNETTPTEDDQTKVEDYIKEIQQEIEGASHGDRYKVDDESFKRDSIRRSEEEQQRRLDSLQSIVYSGESSAEYDLKDRYQVFIPIPAFRCDRNGNATVTIVVNRKGEVTRATLVESDEEIDPCIKETALSAARRSRFNPIPDYKGSDAQKGTITFRFQSQ